MNKGIEESIDTALPSSEKANNSAEVTHPADVFLYWEQISAQASELRKRWEELWGSVFTLAPTTIRSGDDTAKRWRHGSRGDKLSLFDHLWPILTPMFQAKVERFTSPLVREHTSSEIETKEALEVAVGMASVKRLDLSFQDITDLDQESTLKFWEHCLEVAQMLDIDSVSLHLPFLGPDIQHGSTSFPSSYNISGYIPDRETQVLREQGVNVEQEKEKRAEAALLAGRKLIRWYREMRQGHQLSDEPVFVTTHFASINPQTFLSEQDLQCGLSNLQQLQEDAAGELIFLVETQGLLFDQFDRLQKQKIGVVFDVTHMIIEEQVYGGWQRVLQLIRQHAEAGLPAVIHFSQPGIVGNRPTDAHDSPTIAGFFSNFQQQELLLLAAEYNIPVTGEFEFSGDDVKHIIELHPAMVFLRMIRNVFTGFIPTNSIEATDTVR